MTTNNSGFQFTEAKFLEMFERKKKDSEDRGLTFDFSFSEYRALIKNRPNLKCFYTDQSFEMSQQGIHGDDNYPSMERIDENKGYTKGNVVFVRTKVNKLKARYIENGQSRKGISEVDIRILRTIEKVMANPALMIKRMEPYCDLYEKANEVDEQLTARKAQEEAKEERRLQQEEEQKLKEETEARQSKFKDQRFLAETYIRLASEFSGAGVVMELTMKEIRDLMRRTTCSITGVEFDDDNDKVLFVKDKTLPITKDNVALCHIEARKGMDHLQAMGKDVLNNINKFLDKKM
ncbi:anti-sigma factor [Vibrio phage RYC]|nr:anti-sigma factor [Vibrio phage RYC]